MFNSNNEYMSPDEVEAIEKDLKEKDSLTVEEIAFLYSYNVNDLESIIEKLYMSDLIFYNNGEFVIKKEDFDDFNEVIISKYFIENDYEPFTICCNIIYEKISKRAKLMKRHKSLSNEAIYYTDPSLVSKIINKKITSNNPYLVPSRNMKGINRAEEIAKNLGFKTLNDFLWGNREEFETYAPILFLYLILEGRKYCSEDENDTIVKALSCYTPYAINNMYRKLINQNSSEENDFKIVYDMIYNNSIYRNAIAKLYIMMSDDFINLYFSYFKNKTTHKIYEQFKKFFHEKFIPLLDETRYNPNDSYILQSLEHYVEFLGNKKVLINDNHIAESLINEFSEKELAHILYLIDFQSRVDKEIDYSNVIVDKWTEKIIIE